MDFERRNYSELPQPSGAFHHSVRSGNMLFICLLYTSDAADE